MGSKNIQKSQQPQTQQPQSQIQGASATEGNPMKSYEELNIIGTGKIQLLLVSIIFPFHALENKKWKKGVPHSSV